MDKKVWIFAGIVTLLVLTGYMKFFLGPALQKNGRLGSEIKDLRQRLKSTKASLARLPQMEKEIAQLHQKSETLKVRFPSKAELPELLEHLSGIAESSDVKIVEILPASMMPAPSKTEKVGQGAYEELPIAFTAKSGYHELGSFINRLENSERIFTVKDIEVKADPSDPKRHHVRLVVATFVR